MANSSRTKKRGDERWVVKYEEWAVKRDFALLPRDWLVKIKTAVEARLTTEPTLYGKPLRSPLSGFNKLRVGDYRVIFQIKGSLILILAAGHRKNIYQRILSRLRAK